MAGAPISAERNTANILKRAIGPAHGLEAGATKESMNDSAKERELIIEFMGKAGAGKTVLRNEIFRELRRQGLPCRRKIETPAPSGALSERLDRYRPKNLKLRLSCLHVFMRLGANPAYNSNVRRRRRKALRRMYDVARMYRDAARSETAYVVDEGVFQNLRQVRKCMRRRNTARAIDVVLRYLSPPDVLVIVHASEHTIAMRRLARDNFRTRLKNPSRTREPRSVRVMTKIIHEFHQKGAIPLVLDADNDDGADVKQTAQEIAREIARFRNQRVTVDQQLNGAMTESHEKAKITL
jgi:hypothetical protein